MKHINKDYSGNFTLGFEGACIWCKDSQRAYYFYADPNRREAMKMGTFMSMPAHCPACVTKGVPHSMRWKRKLTEEEVVRDLTALEPGAFIDIEAMKDQLKAEERSVNFENEHKAKIAWNIKKAKG